MPSYPKKHLRDIKGMMDGCLSTSEVSLESGVKKYTLPKTNMDPKSKSHNMDP